MVAIACIPYHMVVQQDDDRSLICSINREVEKCATYHIGMYTYMGHTNLVLISHDNVELAGPLVL